MPAKINDSVYECVSSYKKPAIGAPAVIGIEHRPSKNPIPCVAPFEPHKSRPKMEIQLK